MAEVNVDRAGRHCVLLVASVRTPASLMQSYDHAFQRIGVRTVSFELGRAQARHERLGRLGRVGAVARRLLGSDTALRLANRELFLTVCAERPELILVFGPSGLYGGALAQIATTCRAPRVLVWPDTLLNVADPLAVSLPLYDLVACYSRDACAPLRRLGAPRVEWVPLACDPELHPPTGPRGAFRCDVSFIGNWRPERERALAALAVRPEIMLKVWGADWKRYATDLGVLRAFQSTPLFGADFAAAVASSKLSLNIIDPTNGPAANMRFFELSCAGGLQVSTYCDEMADAFVDGEHLFYYRTDAELVTLTRRLLADDSLRARVAAAGHARTVGAHTYDHRVQQLLSALDVRLT